MERPPMPYPKHQHWRRASQSIDGALWNEDVALVLRAVAPGYLPIPRLGISCTGYMHPGMTLVTTDLPAHPDARSGKDFVVISQEIS
jgi:hypothetical protein